MDSLIKDMVLLAARRDKRAREVIKAVNRVRRTARYIQKFAGGLEKATGGTSCPKRL